MPRFKIETSLYEPVTVELKDGRILTSVDFSDLVFKSLNDLDKQKEAGTLDGISHLVKSIALIFGAEREDIETVDFRVLGDLLQYVGKVIVASRTGAPIPAAPTSQPPDTSPVDESVAEKNAPTPEGGISQ